MRVPATRFHGNPLVAHGRRWQTKGVVIHTIEGTDEGAEDWFRSRRARGYGAHLIIGTEPTHTTQITDLDNRCHHATGKTRSGIYANDSLIGIEHEGFARWPKWKWLQKRSMLRRSARRTAWICWHYKLGRPRHGVNVWGHAEIHPRYSLGHQDPGKGWPWLFYMALCRSSYARLRKGGSW